MNVRRALPADLDEVFELFSEVAAEAVYIATEPPIARDDRLEKWRVLLERSDEVMLLAEEDGELVGMATLHGGRNAELGMTVAKRARGRGVGSALLEEIIAWARDAGVYRIELQVWPHNAAALHLYEKFGFSQTRYMRRHYRRRSGKLWDVIFMDLQISDGPQSDPAATSGPTRMPRHD